MATTKQKNTTIFGKCRKWLYFLCPIPTPKNKKHPFKAMLQRGVFFINRLCQTLEQTGKGHHFGKIGNFYFAKHNRHLSVLSPKFNTLVGAVGGCYFASRGTYKAFGYNAGVVFNVYGKLPAIATRNIQLNIRLVARCKFVCFKTRW